MSESTTTATPVAGVTKSCRITSTVTWKDPVKTAKVFAGLIAALLLVRSTCLIRLLVKIATFAIGSSAAVEYATRIFYQKPQGLISSYRPGRLIKPQSYSLDQTAKNVSIVLHGVADEVEKIVNVQDLCLTSSIFGAGLFLYVFLGIFSLWTLVFSSVILAFTVPVVYLQFQKEVDEIIAQVKSHFHQHSKELHSQIHKVAGPHIDKLHKNALSVATSLGYNRGGVPENPTNPQPISDISNIPGAAAAIPASKEKIHITKTSTNVTSTPTADVTVRVTETSTVESSAPAAVEQVPAASHVPSLNDPSIDLAAELKNSIQSDKTEPNPAI